MRRRSGWLVWKEMMRRKFRRLLEPPVSTHPVVWTARIADLEIAEIAANVEIPVFADGDDRGYHDFSNDWWSNTRCPFAFQYPDIDSMYAGAYYAAPNAGHPSDVIAEDLYAYMQQVYRGVFGREFSSILELGTGGGEITRQFQRRDLDLVAVEGTQAGVERLRALGVPPERIVQQNLKFLSRLSRTFDLVMCTEVAEHVEPWFASRIAENCVLHGKAVWFSAADRNRLPHYHHINEIDIAAWDNLFAHLGFPIAIKLDGRHDRASRMYLPKDAKQGLSARISATDRMP